MGLDSVELIMAVEEAFEIEIPDEDAEKVATVGDMYAYVLAKLDLFQAPRCLSSSVFYKTRRTLMDLYDVPRRSIAPATPMASMLPAEDRKSHWQALGRAMDTRLPDLELPRPASRLLAALALGHFGICLAVWLSYPIPIAVLFCFASMFGLWLANRRAAPLAVMIPAECATVGGTVRAVLRRSQGFGTDARRSTTPAAVWQTLRDVIVKQLECPPEAVTPEASFVDDLGAD